MDAAPDYDTSKLQALRRELDKLNAAAAKSGLIVTRNDPAKAGRPAAREPARVEAVDPNLADQGKSTARRLLAILSRVEGDSSPSISGVEFTEDGVVRLLAHLRKRSARAQVGNRFFRRLLAFLTRPVPMGMRTSAGIGVERLQLVARYLNEIETHGWRQFRLIAAARRRKRRVLPSRKDLSSPTPISSRSAH